jgi:hypothetical protein
VPCLDVANDLSVEAAEIAFDEPDFPVDRSLEACRDHARGGFCADERARHQAIDGNLGEAFRRRLRLRDAGGVQGNVAMALITPFQVPIRLAVAQEIEWALWNHGTRQHGSWLRQRASRTNAARLRRLAEAVRPDALFASKAGA